MENAEKDLRERTKKFAHRIIRLYSALPKSTVAQVLDKQLLRSGTSIGANCREADETLYWIELIRDEALLACSQIGAYSKGSK